MQSFAEQHKHTDTESIVSQMHRIRNLTESHVAEMHHQAERLVDWREHVRSKPLVAVGVAAIVGFYLVNKVTGTEKPQESPPLSNAPATARASIGSGVMAFFGSMASNAIKSYVTHYVRTQFSGGDHDRDDSKQLSEAESTMRNQYSR
ncbi:MAG: hypothetical protein R3C53_22155 [Pirellulaceae bacterium]